MEGMTVWHWAGVALAGVLVLHSTKVLDATKLPLVGPLFAKMLTPHKATKAVTVPANIVSVDTLDTGDRCDILFANITALRHYASEQPKDTASVCLDACDVLWAAVDKTHKQHNTPVG